jgi:hypothetical protein
VHLALVDHFFKAALGDEAVDDAVAALAYAVDSVNCLVIVRRIPVRVKNYSPIGTY